MFSIPKNTLYDIYCFLENLLNCIIIIFKFYYVLLFYNRVNYLALFFFTQYSFYGMYNL